MSLRHVLRSSVAAACIAAVAAPSGMIAPAAQAQVRGGDFEVRVAQSEQFSRIEFRGASATMRREGQNVVLAFTRDGDPDISRLRTSPPKWIKTAEKRRNGGRLEVVITLTDDAEATSGSADGATFINIYERPPQQVATAETQVVEAEPPRPNPVPAGGVVKMDSSVSGGQVQFSFTWANLAGAAVYRRGNAIWMIFDASATLDVSSAPARMRQFTSVKAYKGADYSAIRIDAGDDVPAFITSLGPTWTLSLGPGGQAMPGIVRVSRESGGGPPELRAPLAGATRVIQFPDAEAGDIITVVTALGPAKGVASRRDFVQLSMLPSIHGLAIEGHVDNLFVQHEGDIVKMGTPDGLTLSPMWATRDRAQAALGAPKPAAMPALIDEAWSQTGDGGFLTRYNTLFSAAAGEGANKDREAPVASRMALARFLVGTDLSYEAIGVLNDLVRQHPEMLDEPEFRGLRGMARVLARRYKEAEADLASPALADDPSAALWRSYVASQLAHYPESRALFAKGAESFGSFPTVWKARFARAEALAALAQGDLAGADARIRLALAEPTDSTEELATRLLQAQLVEKQGHKDRALKIYDAVARAPMDYLSGPALLGATQIRMELGRITPLQAVAVYDGLRYRWRGDSAELSAIRALGQLYLGQGRYREALEALRTAGGRLPDLPEALQLQSDLAAAFRALFLDGMADGLEPVQALALFYDFKELTPIGADGDLMVRRLVRRLVDVDLLPQAAELLKYQTENRLDGVPKAQVSTDLALIYLMDRKPEQALQAINASRTTVLPTQLNNERRLIEARAWAAVGRFDSALEIIEKDPSKDAGDLRSEITWKQKNWQAAGPLFEKALGERWRNPEALTSEEEGKLLRAGVAYSMAGDANSLQRLEAQYGRFYEKANNPEALRIALSGAPSGPLTVGDFGRVSADGQAFEGWVTAMKARFRNRPSPTSNGAVQAQAQAPAAGAAPPAAAAPAAARPTTQAAARAPAQTPAAKAAPAAKS